MAKVYPVMVQAEGGEPSNVLAPVPESDNCPSGTSTRTRSFWHGTHSLAGNTPTIVAFMRLILIDQD